MAHGLLDGAQVQSGFNQAGAVGMAQAVWGDTFHYSGILGDGFESLSQAAAMHGYIGDGAFGH